MSVATFDEISALATEQRNPDSMKLDEMSVEDILQLINDEDSKVAPAVWVEIPRIAAVVEELITRFKLGGKLFYVGSGTSGRMGIVDAAECPPTFGTSPDMVQGIIAGGNSAVFKAKEGVEDSELQGARAIERANVIARDVVIGIAASKRTPFVLGALKRAFDIGAFTVLLTTNPRESFNYPFLRETICPVVGPEVLMGSTRMKSAVAQKMVLTMITTTAMVRLGKVYENMMVDLQLTNRKLTERARRIVMMAGDCDYEQARELLEKTEGHVKTAIVMRVAKVPVSRAKEMLDRANGFVRKAIQNVISATPRGPYNERDATEGGTLS